jgi:rhodanese-related sulfurtransferase
LNIEQGVVQIVDVRSPEEFSRGHIPFAVNLPVNKLRGSISTLNKGQRIVV